MEQEQFIMKDWQIPFMLLELSSYAQKFKPGHQHKEGIEHLAGLYYFLIDDVNEATDFLHSLRSKSIMR